MKIFSAALQRERLSHIVRCVIIYTIYCCNIIHTSAISCKLSIGALVMLGFIGCWCHDVYYYYSVLCARQESARSQISLYYIYRFILSPARDIAHSRVRAVHYIALVNSGVLNKAINDKINRQRKLNCLYPRLYIVYIGIHPQKRILSVYTAAAL